MELLNYSPEKLDKKVAKYILSHKFLLPLLLVVSQRNYIKKFAKYTLSNKMFAAVFTSLKISRQSNTD